MRETIELTPKSTRWIFVINGVINSVLGLRLLLTTDSWMNWSSILGLLLIVAGPLMLMYGLILFGRNNRLIPQIQVGENEILIKEDIHKIQRRVDWQNIKQITYSPFELIFHLTDNNTETVSLTSNEKISMAVKTTIRRFADGRQIKIVGG